MEQKFFHKGAYLPLWNVEQKFTFHKGAYLPRGEKTVATVVGVCEHDCDRAIPGQHNQCSLCKECLGNAHSDPGKWKCEFQQFLFTYSGGFACVSVVNAISDVE